MNIKRIFRNKTNLFPLQGLGVLLFFILLTTTVKAVDLDSKNRDPKYVENIVGRSKKIVDKLDLKDASVTQNVLNIVANRYFELNDIFSKRDTAVNRIKRSSLKGEAKNNA